MHDPLYQFRDAILSAGLIPPDTIEPGRFHKFPGEGKRNGNTAAWCKLFPDGMGGVFGDYSTGLSTDWQAKRKTTYTPAEREAFKRHVAEAKAQAETERKAKQAEAAGKTATIWQAAQPADNHPYLTRKGIKAHGARLHNDALVIPMREGSELHSLQFIGADGDKRFLIGGRVAGCYYSIGSTKGAAALCIAEGFATGATIHEATGFPVAVAFNAGNLGPVARALRAKLPDLRLILCADDDATTEGNPGLTNATTAARSIDGLVAVPNFGTDRPEGATDFNDLALHRGAEAVKDAVDNASAPASAEHDRDRKNVAAGDPAGRIAYRRASDIQAKPIHWLWQGRIARGKVSMLAGNPGLGKSQVTASMAAVVTTGGTWPVDRTRCERGNVIVLSAEDDPEDTIRPRLEAAGADIQRVFILDAVVEGYRPDGGEIQRAFNLKTDLARLGAMLEEIGGAALIVIDPISAYLGDADSHKNAEIRALLSPLSALAAKHGAAVVCVSHFNKATGGEALMRVTGSLAFVAAARAAFIVAKDKKNDARRLFLPLKNNIGNDQTGLAFAVQSAQVKSPAGLIETSRISWEAEAVTVTADEAMAQQGDPEERDALSDAVVFLRSLLADGPVNSKLVQADARNAGHCERTLRRAMKVAGVKAEKAGMREGWVWRLDSKMAKSPEDGHTKSLDTFGALGHLRQPSEGDSGLVEVEV